MSGDAGYRPALPGAALPSSAADVRRRGLQAHATQFRGGCQVAGYRPALPSSAADVRSRAKSPRYKARATCGRGGCQETRAKGPRSPGLRRMSGRGLKARATRPALPGAAVDVRRRGLKARATRPALQGPRYKARATRDQKLVVLIRLSAGASAAMTRNDKPHQKFGLLIKLDQRHL